MATKKPKLPDDLRNYDGSKGIKKTPLKPVVGKPTIKRDYQLKNLKPKPKEETKKVMVKRPRTVGEEQAALVNRTAKFTPKFAIATEEKKKKVPSGKPTSGNLKGTPKDKKPSKKVDANGKELSGKALKLARRKSKLGDSYEISASVKKIWETLRR